jgi:hypothetical protein
MLLEKPRSGQPSGRSAALIVGWLMVLGWAAASCGHGAVTAEQDAALAAQGDGACVRGPDGSIGDPAPPNCPDDQPSQSDCPDATPSYQSEIAPIIQERCTVCHVPGGLEPDKLFDSYERILPQRARMLVFIYSCRMPPTCATQLTSDERRKLLKWFVCSAPNN